MAQMTLYLGIWHMKNGVCVIEMSAVIDAIEKEPKPK